MKGKRLKEWEIVVSVKVRKEKKNEDRMENIIYMKD